MNKENIIAFIKEQYPTNSTASIAEQLNISIHHVRSIAKRNNIVKCEKYKEQLKVNLIENRKKWYEASIPDFKPTHIQEQIILGSLLGDGYISKGAKRSINYYYQEHFSEGQREYRLWKLSKLKNLHFNINGNYLRSISHPYFTSLHRTLYPNDRKSLTKKYVSKCNHPIFLSTLYLDDGSLTISYHYNKKTHTVYCHPSIVLYTLNLTKEENILLTKHLNQIFNVHFVVSTHPDGHKSLLKINKEWEVNHFLDIIKPYVSAIPSMKYKTCLNENINLKIDNIKRKFGQNVTIKISSSNRRRIYSKSDINTLVKLKRAGCTDQAIANKLGRTYWSVVYKISTLRKKGVL